MMRKSLLQAIRAANGETMDSPADNAGLPETGPAVEQASPEKTKRIVVDIPESQHIEVKIFAARLGLSIKQLVLIALEDVMREEE